MRVTETSTFTNTILQLQRLSTGQNQLQNALATGQRVVRAADDPSAVRRVIDLQSEATGLLRHQRNIASAKSIGDATFAGVDALKQMSDRAGEIAIVADGIGGESDKQAYARELDQMIEQALMTVNARLGEEYLFGGTATDRPPFAVERDAAGRIISVAYEGADERREIQVGERARVTPHADPESNRELASFVDSLIRLRDDLEEGRSPSETGSREELAHGENALIRLVGDIGALQFRLEALDRQAAARLDAIEEGVSRETDADMVETIVRFNQMQNTFQAALQSTGRLLNHSLLNYI